MRCVATLSVTAQSCGAQYRTEASAWLVAIRLGASESMAISSGPASSHDFTMAKPAMPFAKRASLCVAWLPVALVACGGQW
jgi:hypothetical protein